MKTIRLLFLLLTLLTSSIVTSQTTNLSLSKQQAVNIYNGLKQAETLKVMLKDANVVIKTQNSIIEKQDESILTLKETIVLKDKVIEGKDFILEKEKSIYENRITILNNTMDEMIKTHKKEKRKKFWTGLGTGTLIGAAAVIATALIIN